MSELLRKINDWQHLIGIHPSFFTVSSDEKIFTAELETLRKVSQIRKATFPPV
ncbi:MAG: hypothetical protein R2825_22005 [Saprospiraceae bacterium]